MIVRAFFQWFGSKGEEEFVLFFLFHLTISIAKQGLLDELSKSVGSLPTRNAKLFSV